MRKIKFENGHVRVLVAMLRSGLETLLKCDSIHCAVLNKYAGKQAETFLQDHVGAKLLGALPIPTYIHTSRLPPSPQTNDGLLFYYTMDLASLIPVCKLGVQKDSSVLDLCAAPGGKSFAILQILSANGGLALNEPAPARMKRLRDVICKCLPRELLHIVRFTRARGENWARAEPNTFDCVLVDVPCSSDRHTIAERGAERLHKYSERFAVLQEKLLLNGLCAGKEGARVVYSTCTLSERENDQVVARVAKKASSFPGLERVKLQRCCPLPELQQHCHQEQTEYGLLVAPTADRNVGPMYIALLQKCIFH